MKTFKLFVHLYCVLLYVLGLIYSINEYIAYHLHHDFFEGFRVAVPILIFIFFHFPALLFFVIVKDTRKWVTLLSTMTLLFLTLFIGFKVNTFILPVIMLIALIFYSRDLIKSKNPLTVV